MQREALYHKTVNILVDSYFKDTLQHRNCYACAVGNIIAGNMGIKFFKGDKYLAEPCLIWEGKSSTYYDISNGNDYRDTLTAIIAYPRSNKTPNDFQSRQLLATGYNMQELTKIEIAFEKCRNCDPTEDIMFNGLMSVIDALDDIHENKDEVVSHSAKQKFTKRELVK